MSVQLLALTIWNKETGQLLNGKQIALVLFEDIDQSSVFHGFHISYLDQLNKPERDLEYE